MAVSKFRIYDYWKDKAITKKFEIKPVSACTKEDDALSITEFPDEIFCWACQMPPYQQGTHRTLSGLWNGDTLLQRSHILAKSLNGEDKPENYFCCVRNVTRNLRIRRTRSSFSRGSGISGRMRTIPWCFGGI